jgi:glucose-1-phosphate thymidylyltransferase
MKGIIMAGGLGTRLYPSTFVFNKHLLPVYDKPMIYYPLSILLLARISDILIITTPKDTHHFKNLLGDGKGIGVSISYLIQEKPNGIAEAFIIAKEFIADSSVALILGDNIFFGNGLTNLLQNAKSQTELGYANVFAYYVKDPERYGVIEFDSENIALSIEEKPQNPKSNFCVTGLYMYDNSVVNIAERLKPSERGELEITDLNRVYLENKKLFVKILGRGFAWLDTGTHESLLESAQFIHAIEKRQLTKVGVIEEISYKVGFINKTDLYKNISKYGKSDYGRYLEKIFLDKNESL